MRSSDSSRAKAFKDDAPAGSRIWFDEAGAFHTRKDGDADADVSQSKRVAYLVDDLATPLRVERLYYYYFWSHSPKGDSDWPTELMKHGPDGGAPAPGDPLPAYYQYQCRTNPSEGSCPAYGQPGPNP
jgi:hypothetical protein